VRLSVRRIIAENPPVVSGEQVIIDEGQIETDDIAVGVLPDFFPNQPISGGAANGRGFISDLDGSPHRPARRCHARSIAQVGQIKSYLKMKS
jgi:hypothetical protein